MICLGDGYEVCWVSLTCGGFADENLGLRIGYGIWGVLIVIVICTWWGALSFEV